MTPCPGSNITELSDHILEHLVVNSTMELRQIIFVFSMLNLITMFSFSINRPQFIFDVIFKKT